MSLFIGCLPRYDFDDVDLEDIFSKYGPITDCKVLYGTHFGYGFVDYQYPDDMYEAIRNEHGRMIDGVRIVVEKAKHDKDSVKCYSCGKHGHTAGNCWNKRRTVHYSYDGSGDNNYHRNDSYKSERREGYEDDDYYYQSRNSSRRDDDDDEYNHRSSRDCSRRDDAYHRHSHRGRSDSRKRKEEVRHFRHSRSPRVRRCSSNENEGEAKNRRFSSPYKGNYKEKTSYY